MVSSVKYGIAVNLEKRTEATGFKFKEGVTEFFKLLPMLPCSDSQQYSPRAEPLFLHRAYMMTFLYFPGGLDLTAVISQGS